MSNCENNCGIKLVGKPVMKNAFDLAIEEISARFTSEGPALDCANNPDVYAYLLSHAAFYVSEVCSLEEDEEEGPVVFFAAAVDKAAYDKWEEEIEHQHHPEEE